MLGFDVQGLAIATDVRDGSLEKDVIVGVRMRIRVDVDDSIEPAQVFYRLEADLPGGVLGRILSLFLKRRFRTMRAVALKELSGT